MTEHAPHNNFENFPVSGGVARRQASPAALRTAGPVDSGLAWPGGLGQAFAGSL